ncbi:arsenite-activated atpase family protein, partial [Cystoisospora suis]
SSSSSHPSIQQLLSEPPPREASESLEEENQRLRSFIHSLQSRLLEVEKSYFARRSMQSRYLQQIK